MEAKKVKLFLAMGVLLFSFSYDKLLGWRLPTHFPKPIYNFSSNVYSEAKVTLGRALFYDPILSLDNSISCASCHSSYNAFAHTDHALSHGIFDSVGTRNAPALFNLAWQKLFMWDGAVNHIDVQALAPLTHASEMGETLQNVLQKLGRTKLYPNLFYRAFGDSLINTERMLKSLSQFQLSLISAQSKYDRVKLNLDTFTSQEKRGYQLYTKYCQHCHTEPLFSTYQFKQNFLPLDSSLLDYGRGSITHNKQDTFTFKIPSLRNLSYTYPYMHDGRFLNISQVLTHYQNVEMLDRLSSTKPDLIAFLLTLNDSSFVFNPQFKYPREIFMWREGFNK
ncbi:MAG: cytochrome c peroxidase [Bacteroidota bacterium]|nr:cytochrome c peroxidase [Bacteroidota bacterium]